MVETELQIQSREQLLLTVEEVEEVLMLLLQPLQREELVVEVLVVLVFPLEYIQSLLLELMDLEAVVAVEDKDRLQMSVSKVVRVLYVYDSHRLFNYLCIIRATNMKQLY
jgi:hypothetical protein